MFNHEDVDYSGFEKSVQDMIRASKRTWLYSNRWLDLNLKTGETAAKVYLRVSSRHIRGLCHTLELSNLLVVEGMRNKGIGWHLLVLLTNLARSNNKILYIENVMSPEMRRLCKNAGARLLPNTEPECYVLD